MSECTIIKLKMPNEDKDTIIEIPDLKYLEQYMHRFENIMRDHILSSAGLNPNDKCLGVYFPAMKVKPEVKELDLTKKEINVNNIEQDSSHRMLTDAQILLFKNKPTLEEVDDRIKSVAEELKTIIEKMFTDVLNLPQALSNLQQIAELFAKSPLNTEDGIKRILEKFAELKCDLQEHIESGRHVNNSERKALNLTIDLVNSGMLDKACSGSVPHAEVADNAKSLNGVSVEDIRGRHLEEVIYGIQPYDSTKVDVLFDKSSILDTKFNSTIPTIGIIGFKPGTYDSFDTFNIKSENDIIVNGSGQNSTIIIANNIVTRNNQIRDCCFRGTTENPCKFDILNNTMFDNCKFINCEVNINADNNVKFINCVFISTRKFEISKTSGNIIITNNIFDINSKLPLSHEITNRIIKDNLYKY